MRGLKRNQSKEIGLTEAPLSSGSGLMKGMKVNQNLLFWSQNKFNVH